MKKCSLTEPQRAIFDKIDTSLQCAPDCPAVSAACQLKLNRPAEYEDLVCKVICSPGELTAMHLSKAQYEILKTVAQKSESSGRMPRRSFLKLVAPVLAGWSFKGATVGLYRHAEVKKIKRQLREDTTLTSAERIRLGTRQWQAEESAESNALQAVGAGMAAMVADTAMQPYNEELSVFIGTLEQCIGDIRQQNAAGKKSPYHYR